MAEQSTLRQQQENGTWVNELAERIGSRADAHTSYGDPIEREGVTVIPVSKIRYALGGGGGSGSREDGHEEGAGGGGGGGAQIIPIGYIEMKRGRSNFHRIQDTTALIQIMIAAGVSFWLVFRALRLIDRR